MAASRKLRRTFLMALVSLVAGVIVSFHPSFQEKTPVPAPPVAGQAQVATEAPVLPGTVKEALAQLQVKGRASKTGYARAQFGQGWGRQDGCDTRNIILNRDLTGVITNEKCQVVSGELLDPYTGTVIAFARGSTSSQVVQIDHVVALSDAWQKGAQQLSNPQREAFANDPLNLLAVDGKANQAKGDGDAATWLPSNKPFRCEYVSRQVAVKLRYTLWVTQAEKEAIERVLTSCPDQQLIK